MSEQRFETGNAPHIVVNECGGALVVGSWKGTAVLAQGPDFTANSPSPDQLELISSGDLALTVPEKASLTVKNCDGTVVIKHVDGVINMGLIIGTVTLNDVGSVKITVVAGDFIGENFNGPLRLEYPQQRVTLRNVADVMLKKVLGATDIQYANGKVKVLDARDNVTFHTVTSDVLIGRAWGNEVKLSNLGGANTVEDVSGALHLIGGLANGEHRFQTIGDILVAWPVDAPLTLVAEGAIIDNQLPLSDAAKTNLDDGRTQLTGHIEQGKPFVSLKTTGNIGIKPLRPGDEATLSAADFDFSPPPPTLEKVVETAVTTTFPTATPDQIEQITDAIEEHLEEAETIALPTPSPSQVAAAKAQKKVEKSLQKAADSITEAQNKLTPPPQPEPIKSEVAAVDTAVAPSQIQILQLLKEGAITVEQANILLDNLRTT